MGKKKKKEPIPCDVCQKKFSVRSSWIRHMRVFHNKQPELRRKEAEISCPNSSCKQKCASMQALREHVAASHGVQIETKYLSFLTVQDFLNWKELTEKKSWCRYILRRGAANGISSTISYYMCHRSGRPAKSVSTGKRNRTNSKSYKLGAFCPAQMIVTVTKNVKVEFHTTHYGHNIDYRRAFLTASDRKEIADKLRNGIDKSKILEDIRTKSFSEGFQRISLVTRKDLHNIARNLNIPLKGKSHEENDVIEESYNEEVPDNDMSVSPVPNENSLFPNENEELGNVLKKARMLVDITEKNKPMNSDILKKMSRRLDKLMSLANITDTSHNTPIQPIAKEPVHINIQPQMKSPSIVRKCLSPYKLILLMPVANKTNTSQDNSPPQPTTIESVNNKSLPQQKTPSTIKTSTSPTPSTIKTSTSPAPSTIKTSTSPTILVLSKPVESESPSIKSSNKKSLYIHTDFDHKY